MSFDTWSPLFSSIIKSSIWGAEKHVRILWVTILAVKDKDGFVDATVPGLARMAALDVEECRDAIRVLESPDPDSNNSEYEGRRLAKVDGGWKVLSHKRYQDKMKDVTDKINNAKRQREWRERQRAMGPRLPGETMAQRMEENGFTQDQIDKAQEGTLPEPKPRKEHPDD
jgi:hypothetical protein